MGVAHEERRLERDAERLEREAARVERVAERAAWHAERTVARAARDAEREERRVARLTVEDHGGDAEPGAWREATIPVTLGEPIELAAENANGAIAVVIGDGPEVVVRSRKTGDPTARRYRTTRLRVDANDNRISVRVEHGGPGDQGEIADIGGFVQDVVQDALRDVFGRKGGKDAPETGDDDRERHRARPRDGGGRVRYDLEIALPRAGVNEATPARVQIRNASGASSAAGITGEVRIQTASGAAAVADLVGRVTVESASGDVEARRVRGELAISSASGAQRVEWADGPVTLRTASGDLRLDGGSVPRFELDSASGDLTADVALVGDGPYRVNTVSGSVRLAARVPAAGRGAELTFRSLSGRATAEPPWRETGRRAWRLGPGDAGGPRITVNTVSGGLVARASFDERLPDVSADLAETAPIVVPPPPAPPAPPPVMAEPVAPVDPIEPIEPVGPPPPVAAGAPARIDGTPPEPAAARANPDRLAVLELLERGEIEVEDALALLDPDPADPAEAASAPTDPAPNP